MSGERSDPADWAGSYDKGTVAGPAGTEPIEETGERESLAFPERATWVMTRRALAHFADGCLYLLIVIALSAVSAALSDVLLTVMLVLLLIPGPVIYYVLTQRATGRSPGKRLAGIRVVDAAGSVPSTGALVRRSIPLIFENLLAVAFFAMLFSPTRQRLGDRWAHTYVIEDGDARIEERATEYHFSCALCGETFRTEGRAMSHVKSFHKKHFPDARDGVIGA